MKQKKEIKKFDINKFELLSTEGNILKGGFSSTLSYYGGVETEPTISANIGNCSQSTNNCQGGNCVAGCGTK